MDIRRIMQIMDASYRTRCALEDSLHDMDRRALNAMVLVKRHGNKLAGYGVIAQAFREQAANLEQIAAPLQQSIGPLVRAHMRILQHRRFAEMFHRTLDRLHRNVNSSHLVCQSEGKWQRIISGEEAETRQILRHLLDTVMRLQEGIAEQEYVVTNGRIEAALSEHSGAPLMRVSQEMGLAVTTVRTAIWKYRSELEEVLHESRTSL